MKQINVIKISIQNDFDADHQGATLSNIIDYANKCEDQINIVKVQLDATLTRQQILDYVDYFNSCLCSDKNILLTTIK